MNKIINKFSLTRDKFIALFHLKQAGDKSIPVLHLKQTGFTYRACGPFTKHRKRNKKFRETGE